MGGALVSRYDPSFFCTKYKFLRKHFLQGFFWPHGVRIAQILNKNIAKKIKWTDSQTSTPNNSLVFHFPSKLPIKVMTYRLIEGDQRKKTPA